MDLESRLWARMRASAWNGWFERAEGDATALAQGHLRRRRRGKVRELPEPVVALLAIADLKDMVLELAAAIDAIARRVEATP